MNLAGISDSLAGVTLTPQRCPVCQRAIRIRGGQCLNCLLSLGREPEEKDDATESDFVTLLTKIDLPDSDWRLGNYQILEEIGRGGMGVIYRARQRHSRRIVALKRILNGHGDSRETLERFRREAQAAASLDHPNLLPIYEVNEAEGMPYFTMKYATGGTLQQASNILRGDTRECVHLLAKVARAVAHAHRHGILHRDLKPGNVLLDSLGEPMVSDFGLAKWIDAESDLTRSLAIFGTPGFIAPEQATGNRDELTPGADVYSLGAILFYLLTGRAPFLGEHAFAVINRARETAAPKLRSLIPNLDRDLETICAKCLEREPKARYPSATDLAEDVERWLQGRPIIARPVLPPVKMWRWSRRNPIIATTAALCLAVATIAGVGQVNNWRLRKQVYAQAAAQHSIEMMPILDLDAAKSSPDLTDEIGAELQRKLNALGPATVASGKPREGIPARAHLVGTTRIRNGKRRIVLHLLEANSQTSLLQAAVETDESQAVSAIARQLSNPVYAILSNADLNAAAPRSTDPGLLDPETKNFIEHGLELARRRGGLDLERSIACLQQAVQLQPKSSAACAALAKAFSYRIAFQAMPEARAPGLEYAHRALALDPASGDAHLALAAVLFHTGKIKQSLEEGLTVLECAPTLARAPNLLANIDKAVGRPDRALRWLAMASPDQAASDVNEAWRADCRSYLGEDAEAEEAYQHARRLHPENPEGWIGLCRQHLLNGQLKQAAAICQQELKDYADFSYAVQMAAQVEFFSRNFSEAKKIYQGLHARNRYGGGNFYGAISYASALGRLDLEGNPSAAQELLREAEAAETALLEAGDEDPQTLYRLAAVKATRGEISMALDRLGEAVESGMIDYRSFEMDPRFDSIRSQPRYRELLQAMVRRVEALRLGTNH